MCSCFNYSIGKFPSIKVWKICVFMECCKKSKPRNNKLKLNYSYYQRYRLCDVIIVYNCNPVYYNVALVHVSKHCQLIITVKQNGVVCVVYWIFLKGTLLLTVVVFLRCDLQLKADFMCIFAIPFLELNEESFIFQSTILDALVCNACYFLN